MLTADLVLKLLVALAEMGAELARKAPAEEITKILERHNDRMDWWRGRYEAITRSGHPFGVHDAADAGKAAA